MAMPLPTMPSDWSYDLIREGDAARANQLASCPEPNHLVDQLVAEVGDPNSEVHFACDSQKNEWAGVRSIIQFRVRPDIYDWFFNSHNGYRAHYWSSPDTGLHFNDSLVRKLMGTLSARMEETITARKIETDLKDHHDTYAGEQNFSKADFLKSFSSKDSKIWICERLYDGKSELPRPIYIELFSISKGYRSVLDISRWKYTANPKTGKVGEGCQAPYSYDGNFWLDIKGGFILQDGTWIVGKPTSVRSDSLHTLGWT